MARKRANGEGSFQQLPSGSWRAQATINGRRVSVTGKTNKEAQGKLRKLLADADRGLQPPTEHPTVAQHLDRWLADVVEHSRRPRTVRNYRDTARLYIVPNLGLVKITQLQPSQVQGLYATMRKAGLSPKTIRIAHGVLHCALEQAVAWNLVPRNVAALAEPPRVIRKEIAILQPEQAKALLALAAETRWHALFALALATGMRQGELLGTTWADVDLDAGLVRVRRQLGRDGQLAETKSGNGNRVIDLPASTVTALREHRRRQNEERLLVGPQWEQRDLLFCTHRGRPLGWRFVSRTFKALLTRADLPDVPFHALRHTAATLLLLQGIHPKMVQERLGHASISMTLDIYSHLIPGMGRAAADRLDALLA